jgi:hypothetical protein
MFLNWNNFFWAMGLFVHTSDRKNDLRNIVKHLRIGGDSLARNFQVPKFRGVPIIFSSYICEGYSDVYDVSGGIIFSPLQREVYAIPTDSYDLMRNGSFLPGHERFVFNSLKEMRDKYPSSENFKKDFQQYFISLNPVEIYPRLDIWRSELEHEMDYCLKKDWNPGCNEIAFSKPLDITDVHIFKNSQDLKIRYCESQ